MNRKERERLVVFNKVKSLELSREEAGEVLGLSLRQIQRLYPRFLLQGDSGLVHGSRGRRSPREIGEAERVKALELYRTVYRGFGPTLFAEKLGERDGIWVSHDTARRWLQREGLLERGRRGRRSRRRRERKERFGEMVQMDGSSHAWFGGVGRDGLAGTEGNGRCVLMTVIDDATGRRRGHFYPGESLFAAMDMFGRWCARFGVPSSLYVDRHGNYRADRAATTAELLAGEKPVTQFGRAMKELGVKLILARSPQAKGRVERSNGVMQDRLVKELALAGIEGMDQANAWLETSRFFEKIDEKFALEAVDAVDAHRPLVLALPEVLCLKEVRTVGLDGCVQWDGRVLQLEDPRSLRSVEIWERFDGMLTVLGDGRRLSWKEIDPAARRAAREERHQAARPPVRNNQRHKPGPRQQIKLPGSRPPRGSEPVA